MRVKSVSSSSCTLSQASSFLHRFLSSDACSDSFVRGYADSVAQALNDSDSKSRRDDIQITPHSSSARKLTGNLSLPCSSPVPVPVPASGNGERFYVVSDSATVKNEITKKKKRKRPSLDGNDVTTEDAVNSQNLGRNVGQEAVMEKGHRKKRRKEEQRQKERDEAMRMI